MLPSIQITSSNFTVGMNLYIYSHNLNQKLLPSLCKKEYIYLSFTTLLFIAHKLNQTIFFYMKIKLTQVEASVIAGLVLGLSAQTFWQSSAIADTRVRGYHRSNGTYVQPYYRSDPNGTKSDNYSNCGNVNPYTGQTGTRNCNSSNSPQREYPNSSPTRNHRSYWGR